MLATVEPDTEALPAMTGREAMLAAIAVNPGDDLVRLVYADWLEEFGTTDADAACAEFIRLDCRRTDGKTGRLTPAAGNWLTRNWRRLIPTASPFFSPDTAGGALVYREGRVISTYPSGGFYRLDLRFDRGFLTWVYSPRGWRDHFANPVVRLLLDQPAAECRIKLLDTMPVRYEPDRGVFVGEFLRPRWVYASRMFEQLTDIVYGALAMCQGLIPDANPSFRPERVAFRDHSMLRLKDDMSQFEWVGVGAALRRPDVRGWVGVG